ncbi:MAG: cation transporter [Deltaproteobacteria bacterium]|nr:MAG: cation transporter [Deltaproteobacteria bacterium]
MRQARRCPVSIGWNPSIQPRATSTSRSPGNKAPSEGAGARCPWALPPFRRKRSTRSASGSSKGPRTTEAQMPLLHGDGKYDARTRQVFRVLGVTLALNVLVAVLKLVWGSLAHSTSMVADGIHSLLDGSSNVLGLFGIAIAAQPPDEDHHYGHRKFEVLAAMGISFLLFLAAYEIVSGAIARLAGESPPLTVTNAQFAVMIFTMAVNGLVSRYERRKGKELDSPVLVGDAAHTASDIFASFSVLVSLVAGKFGYGAVDLLVAIGIGFIIGHAAFKIIRANFSVISDSAVIPASEVIEIVEGFPEVKDCHKVRTRSSGDVTFIDFHVKVDSGMSIGEAHDLSNRVEQRLQESFPGQIDITLHLEPGEIEHCGPEEIKIQRGKRR